MLIDTDVLIWMTRGHAGAAIRLQTLLLWRISAVTDHYECVMCVDMCHPLFKFHSMQASLNA